MLPESNYLLLNILVSTKLNKTTDNQLSIHGISFTEYMILHQLQAAPQTTMRRIDLAEAIGITASGVTRLLAPMQKIGLLEKQKNPRDARVSLVKLTKAGDKLYRQASKSFEQFAQTKMSIFSKNQLQVLSELTQKML